MSNNFTTARASGVRHHCVVVRESVGVDYSVSDFDEGDLEQGDTASCAVFVNVPDGYEVEINPIPGYTVTGTAPNFTVSWEYQANTSNPQQPLSAEIISPEGYCGELTGSDFFLCSGGGGDPSIVLEGEGSVKEFCRRGKPSVWQDSDGNVLEFGSIEFCESFDKVEITCKKARVLCVPYDNGRTPGSSWNNAGTAANFIRFNWPLEIVSWDYNGVQQLGAGQSLGPYTQWTPQLQGWSDTFNDLAQNSRKMEAAFGFLPAPTWRYSKITTIDPCVKFGLLHAIRTDLEAPANQYWIAPVREYSVERVIVAWCCHVKTKNGIETQWYDQADDGSFFEIDAPTWQPVEGGASVPIPEDCFIPCDDKFDDWLAEGAVSPCVTAEYPLCDILEDGTSIEVILYVTDCEGARTRELYTADQVINSTDPLDPDVDQYVVQGELKNCDGTEFVEPPVEFECNDLDNYRVDCPDPCAQSATRLTSGRPNNAVSVEYAGVTGETFNEFVSAWEATGGKHYITNQNGTGDGTGSIEAHWICPAVEGFVVLFDGEPIENGLTLSPNPMAEALGCLPTKALQVKLCPDDLEHLAGGDVFDCVVGGGDEQSEPVTHTTQDNNTDFSWSYNQTTLKLQGQSPFNSPDAAPFFDAIVDCIEGGGIAKITFTDPDGIVGTFNADMVLNDGYTTGLFSGVGDTTLLQSGKVRTATTICCSDGEAAEIYQAQVVKVCGLDEIKAKLCAIENNTSPAIRVQVLPLCDDINGDGSDLVNIFVQYTSEQGQPVLVEYFSDAGLTQAYNIGDRTPVDCATGETVEPPEPLPLESNHLIEGCIEVDGDPVKAFTIVDQSGAPLFAPRALESLGFVDCCPAVEVPE